MSSPLRVVLTTAPDAECARRIASALLDARVAACVSVLPGLESHYEWEGRRERSAEVLLLIKTTAAREAGLREVLSREHPYECPELLALDAAAWLEAYGGWVRAAVDGDQRR